jgi:hypothetical protein
VKSVRWILSALALLPCTFVGAIGGGDVRWPPPRGAELEPARTQLLASLEACGGREVRVLRDLDLPSVTELPLTPGKCLTAIVVARTSYPVQASFRDEHGAPLVISEDAHVTALSICHLPSFHVARLHVRNGVLGNLSAHDGPTGPQRIDVHVIEGDGSSPEALAAGRPTFSWNAALQPAALYAHHRARAASASSEGEGAWLDVEVALEPFTVTAAVGPEPTAELAIGGGALLLPRSPITEAWLQEAARFGCPTCRGTPRVHPESRRSSGVIDAAPLEVDPEGVDPGGDPESVAPEAVVEVADPLWHGPASFWRVIAVIDPGDLPPASGVGDEVPCATIRLRRFGAGSARYARTTSLAEAPTFLDDGSDRFCPGDPVRLYVAPRDDRTVHHVALRVEPTRGPRRVGAAPIVGEHPRLIDARARCEAEPHECLALARMLHHGTYAAPEPNGATIAFRRACEEAGIGCLELVANLDELDPRQGLAWMQNHCRSSAEAEPATEPRSVLDGAVCATLGDRHRLARGTGFDLRAAREAYVRGCELGDANACHDREALDLLNL